MTRLLDVEQEPYSVYARSMGRAVPYFVLDVSFEAGVDILPRILICLVEMNLTILRAEYSTSGEVGFLRCALKGVGPVVDASALRHVHGGVSKLLSDAYQTPFRATRTTVIIISDRNPRTQQAIAAAIRKRNFVVHRAHLSTSGSRMTHVVSLSQGDYALSRSAASLLAEDIQIACASDCVEISFSHEVFKPQTARPPPRVPSTSSMASSGAVTPTPSLASGDCSSDEDYSMCKSAPGFGRVASEYHTTVAALACAMSSRNFNRDVIVRIDGDGDKDDEHEARPTAGAMHVAMACRSNRYLAGDVLAVLADVGVTATGFCLAEEAGESRFEVMLSKTVGSGQCLDIPHKRDWLRGVLRAVASTPPPESSGGKSLFEYIAEARPGFYAGVASALSKLGVFASWARVSRTIDATRMSGTFHIVDYKGRQFTRDGNLDVINRTVIDEITLFE